MMGRGTLGRSEHGITGLETAIILIAFVVVASVFAFTVLSVGIFTSERSKETALAGVEETQSTMRPTGGVVALTDSVSGTTSVTRLKFTVGLSTNAAPIELTPAWNAASSGASPTSSGNDGPTVVSYTDTRQHVAETNWTLAWLGDSDGDDMLEGDETAEITVWLQERAGDDTFSIGSAGDNFLDNLLTKSTTFSVTISPSVGATFELQRTIPASLDTALFLD
jgi:flagellin FlaB